jgi:alkylation response protein AidB-like acyl-CoA dehydrogenase
VGVQTAPSVDYVQRAAALAAELRATAAQRDLAAGTPRAERERIRASGLLRLMVPVQYGGLGGSWPTLIACVREIAAADASLAHLFGYHHLEVVTPHLMGTTEQRAQYYQLTTQHNWFWGNAINPLDTRVTLTDGRLRGTKSFCTGAKDSDLLLISAIRPGQPGLVVAVIPTGRAGVTVHDDWANMGQRQTDSGSVTFEDVAVAPDEILGPPGPGGSVFASLRPCVTQTILSSIFVGVAQGALDEARRFTAAQAKPFPGMAVERPAEDPYVLHHFGDMWAALSGAVCLVERAADALQTAWEAEDDLTPEARGICAVTVSTAKLAAGRVALDVTSRMFEDMGARATMEQHRFDRFWRNVRTLTLHDPLDYKAREVGDWALNGRLPTPSFYS